MAAFAPVLLFLFCWIFIFIPLTVAKNKARQKNQDAQKKPANPAPAAKPQPVQPEHPAPLQPTVTEPDHDDSVFTGSLGALSTEGYDPCHEDQMRSMEPVCAPAKSTAPAVHAPPAKSGLPLGWTGSDVVRGIVMSEILTRKR